MAEMKHTSEGSFVSDGEDWVPFDLNDVLRRLDELERTLAGLQILLGKASEYKARPKKGRLPR
jgi:hypothetical protein